VFAPSRRWQGGGFAVRYDATTDRLGYRRVGADTTPPADALRLLFVGDSFVFGDGVQDDDTWPARLQALLACDRPVVVYNAGVPGGSLPEAIAMTERARVLEPHAIVGEITLQNDLRDLAGPTYWSQMEARRRAGPLRDVALRTLAHVGLWNLLRRQHIRLRNRALADVPAEASEAARERYADMLATWAARLRRDGVPLVFAVYPSYRMLTEDDRVLRDWAVATARRAGLEPVDLWPILARGGIEPSPLYLVPRDGHPSGAGYELAARAVAVALSAQAPAFAGCSVR
jgi:lysophospholipase L1-like esterase